MSALTAHASRRSEESTLSAFLQVRAAFPHRRVAPSGRMPGPMASSRPRVTESPHTRCPRCDVQLRLPSRDAALTAKDATLGLPCCVFGAYVIPSCYAWPGCGASSTGDRRAAAQHGRGRLLARRLPSAHRRSLRSWKPALRMGWQAPPHPAPRRRPDCSGQSSRIPRPDSIALAGACNRRSRGCRPGRDARACSQELEGDARVFGARRYAGVDARVGATPRRSTDRVAYCLDLASTAVERA